MANKPGEIRIREQRKSAARKEKKEERMRWRKERREERRDEGGEEESKEGNTYIHRCAHTKKADNYSRTPSQSEASSQG